MGTRSVREALLDSDRYWEVDSDTQRMMFMHFILLADDFGNCEATAGFIRRRVFGAGMHPEGQPPQTNSARLSDDVISKLLAGLEAADLLRTYEANGKRYVHIPRFRQRLRAYKRTNPRPPSDKECSEIKELIENLLTSDRAPPSYVSSPPSSAAEGSEGSEGSEEKKTVRADPTPVDNFGGKNGGIDPPAESKPAHVNGGKPPKPPTGWRRDSTAAARYGEQLGVRAHNGEPLDAYVARIDVALQAAKARARSRAH